MPLGNCLFRFLGKLCNNEVKVQPLNKPGCQQCSCFSLGNKIRHSVYVLCGAVLCCMKTRNTLWKNSEEIPCSPWFYMLHEGNQFSCLLFFVDLRNRWKEIPAMMGILTRLLILCSAQSTNSCERLEYLAVLPLETTWPF